MRRLLKLTCLCLIQKLFFSYQSLVLAWYNIAVRLCHFKLISNFNHNVIYTVRWKNFIDITIRKKQMYKNRMFRKLSRKRIYPKTSEISILKKVYIENLSSIQKVGISLTKHHGYYQIGLSIISAGMRG